MPDYSQGKIYKLINNVNNRIYIGSTIQSLSKRLHNHKLSAVKNKYQKVYMILNKVGWKNIKIRLIEVANVETKEELLRCEQYFIDLYKPSLNTVMKPAKSIPIRRTPQTKRLIQNSEP